MSLSVVDAGVNGARGLARRVQRGVLDRWSVGALVVALVVAAPVISVIALAFGPSENIWAHLAATVLPTYVRNTFWLMLGVGATSLVLGVGTAWLVTLCQFPGRRVFEWALLVPLAVPAYVIAYVYTDLLEFAGPIQSGLRAAMGWRSAMNGALTLHEPRGKGIEFGVLRPGLLADIVIVPENPLANLKVLYGTGSVRLNEETGEPERVGGVRWTVKDGIVYDAVQLRADVAAMVQAQKDGAMTSTSAGTRSESF